MPLDKIEDVEKFVQTHKALILHIRDSPVACIIEDDLENISKYTLFENKSKIKASLRGFLNKHEGIGLLMGCKFKVQINEEVLEYTTYPTDEFIDAVILNEMIFLIDSKMGQIFSCKISTDQFVKTKSEFNKFQEIITNQK
tara:strand:+ start:12 stop:434 length:423 start_codon:yes stop_codon:yes gene_type:complete